MRTLIQNQKAFVVFLALYGGSALAASGGHGGHGGVPWGMIFTQLFNLTVLLVVLYFALRKKVVQHFLHRSAEYNELVNKAEKAKQEAEKNKREIAERLTKLKQTSEQSLKQVKAEAEQLKTRIVTDAQAVAAKLEQDAKTAIKFEVDRAKDELRKELLARGLEDAEKSITADVKDQDLRRMQTEFVQRVQVGGQS